VALPPPAGAVPGSPVSVVPAKRPITIRDLLTHTAGISYGNGPAQDQWKAAGIQGWYCRPQRAGVRGRRAHGRPADGRAARREGVRLQHRHSRRGGREGLGPDPGGVLPEADHGPPRPRGHPVLPAPGAEGPPGDGVRGEGGEDRKGDRPEDGPGPLRRGAARGVRWGRRAPLHGARLRPFLR
jgi:hypothetical protein